jgi:hypothetical protein
VHTHAHTFSTLTLYPLPQVLNDYDLTAIADTGEPISYAPGELVAASVPGKPATAFYLVRSGEVLLLPPGSEPPQRRATALEEPDWKSIEQVCTSSALVLIMLAMLCCKDAPAQLECACVCLCVCVRVCKHAHRTPPTDSSSTSAHTCADNPPHSVTCLFTAVPLCAPRTCRTQSAGCQLVACTTTQCCALPLRPWLHTLWLASLGRWCSHLSSLVSNERSVLLVSNMGLGCWCWRMFLCVCACCMGEGGNAQADVVSGAALSVCVWHMICLFSLFTGKWDNQTTLSFDG